MLLVMHEVEQRRQAGTGRLRHWHSLLPGESAGDIGKTAATDIHDDRRRPPWPGSLERSRS